MSFDFIVFFFNFIYIEFLLILFVNYFHLFRSGEESFRVNRYIGTSVLFVVCFVLFDLFFFNGFCL